MSMGQELYLERAMGIEPTALCLGSRCSTTELRSLFPAAACGVGNGLL